MYRVFTPKQMAILEKIRVAQYQKVAFCIYVTVYSTHKVGFINAIHVFVAENPNLKIHSFMLRTTKKKNISIQEKIPFSHIPFGSSIIPISVAAAPYKNTKDAMYCIYLRAAKKKCKIARLNVIQQKSI